MSNEKRRVVAGEISPNDLSQVREAVCVQVEKIYDSCRDRDCIEDAQVLFRDSDCIRWLIKNAINVKARNAEIIDVYADLEPVPFKRGFYTVDVKYFIKVTLDFFVPNSGPGNGIKIMTKNGLVLFDKKVILFGSEGGIKIFKSAFVEDGIDKPIRSRLQQSNLPVSKVEVAEPIALNANFQDIFDCDKHDHRIPEDLFDAIEDFENGILEGVEERGPVRRKVVVTLGLFSIIKLVRFVQLLVPAFDFCVPNKVCLSATDENPCEIFDTIDFPVDEFFPPQRHDFPGLEDIEDHKCK